MGRKSKKHSIMRAGVVFFFLLILVLWLFNASNLFQKSNTSSSPEDQNEWKELRQDLDETINDISIRFKEIKDNKEEDDALSDDLIKELLDATKELAPVSEETNNISEEPENVGSMTNINCPEWINCMPTIDTEIRPCQILPGCEGITQIAY